MTNSLFNNLSIYILTGGKSKRMGKDKALTILENETFLDHIIKGLFPLNTNSIRLISSNVAHQNLGYTCISDISQNKGPVAGITTALKNTNTQFNLILSCDIPLLQFELINWLSLQHKSIFDITIACHNEKKMPLVAIYDKRCLPVFETHLEKKQLKLMNVIDDLKVNYVSVPSQMEDQLTNINTPSQLNNIVLCN